jgi:hypothetical protein
MEKKMNIRDEFSDLESLQSPVFTSFADKSDMRMLRFFIEMDSEFEFIEFERWLLG